MWENLGSLLQLSQTERVSIILSRSIRSQRIRLDWAYREAVCVPGRRINGERPRFKVLNINPEPSDARSTVRIPHPNRYPLGLIVTTHLRLKGQKAIFNLWRALATHSLSHLSRCLPQRSVIHLTTQAGHRPSRDPDAAIAQGGGARIHPRWIHDEQQRRPLTADSAPMKPDDVAWRYWNDGAPPAYKYWRVRLPFWLALTQLFPQGSASIPGWSRGINEGARRLRLHVLQWRLRPAHSLHAPVTACTLIGTVAIRSAALVVHSV
jgi:hypothetical protein